MDWARNRWALLPLNLAREWIVGDSGQAIDKATVNVMEGSGRKMVGGTPLLTADELIDELCQRPD